jgi:hypothetical protein
LYPGTSRQHFSILKGPGPRLSSSDSRTRAQWSDKPLSWANCKQLGHVKIHSSENKNLTRRLIERSSPLYQVNFRPHNGRSIKKLSSMNRLKLCNPEVETLAHTHSRASQRLHLFNSFKMIWYLIIDQFIFSKNTDNGYGYGYLGTRRIWARGQRLSPMWVWK